MEDSMKKYLFFLLALFLVVTGTVYGDYYTWEDEDGVMQITDYPPPDSQKVQKMKSYKLADPSSSKPAEQVVKKPDVVLYTKNNCADCDKAREFIQSAKVDFTEYNMDEDDTAAAARKTIDDSTDVPFAIINKQHVYGFKESVYSRLLAIKP
jgi:glutaredoxin